MADIVIHAGDRLPIIERTVSVDGANVNITGGSAVFSIIDPSTMSVVLSESAILHQPSQGILQYAWSTAAGALPAGNYFAQFVVTLAGKILTAPNDGYLTLLISGPTGTFTYSGDPSLRPLDRVRYLLNDTDPTDYYLSDAEIAFHLSETGDSIYQAAHDACYALAGRFARMADSISKSVGDFSLSKSYSNKAQQYLTLAERFIELSARREPPMPRANAQALTSIAKRGVVDPTTEFWLGVHDNPGQ